MGFLSSMPVVEYLNYSFDLNDEDCINILYEFDALPYSYDDFRYILNLDFIPESKGYFKPQSLDEVLKLFEIRAKKEPPLDVSWASVIEMFTELRSVKFKELKQTKNSVYNVQLNGEKICIESYESVNEEMYNSDLYELGFIDEYTIIDLIETAHRRHTKRPRGGTFEELMVDAIARIIKDKVSKQFKIDKKQKSLFPKNEKDYIDSRLMYTVSETAKNLYSDDTREMLRNIEKFKTGADSPSNDTLYSVASEIGDIFEIYPDEDIDSLDVFIKKYNINRVIHTRSGYAMQ